MERRAYSKKDLAMAYADKGMSQSAAMNRFRRWIQQNEKLQEELCRTGYNPNSGRYVFNIQQVEIIFRYLGRP